MGRGVTPPVLVLGPQRPHPNLRRVLDDTGVSGPYALITAGWRHDEAEIEPLEVELGQGIVHIPLYRWFETISKANLEVSRDYRQRQAAVTH